MNFKATSVAACLLFASANAIAVELSLLPSSVDVTVGDSFSIELNVSNLGDFASPSLGSYYARIDFDEAILGLGSVGISNFLGDPADPFETSVSLTPGSDYVGIDVFSFLLEPELDMLQPSGFTLATLHFTAVAVGTSSVSIDPDSLDLGSAAGVALVPTATNASLVTVSARPAPLPPTVLLLAAGLPFVRRRK